jgi:uncharacterized protein (TIRG00374 family)
MLENISFKKIGKFIPIIGIVLFVGIIYNIGIEKIIQSFKLIPPFYFLLALLLFIPKLLLATYKWQYISRIQKMNFKFLDLAKFLLISLFYGSITPGALGLHIRIYFIKTRTKDRLEKCLANSMIDVMLALISGLFLAMIGSLIILNNHPEIFTTIFFFFILYVVTFIFFMEKKRGSKLFTFLLGLFIPKSYKENLDDTISHLYKDIPKISSLIFPLCIDFIIWFVAATQVYVLAQAFSIPIPYITFILISIISVMISNVIPISVGGLGVREGAFVVMLASYGIPSDIAFVLSLAGFLVKNLIPGLFGIIIAFLPSQKDRIPSPLSKQIQDQ